MNSSLVTFGVITFVLLVGYLVLREIQKLNKQVDRHKSQIKRLKSNLMHGHIETDMTNVGFRTLEPPLVHYQEHEINQMLNPTVDYSQEEEQLIYDDYPTTYEESQSIEPQLDELIPEQISEHPEEQPSNTTPGSDLEQAITEPEVESPNTKPEQPSIELESEVEPSSTEPESEVEPSSTEPESEVEPPSTEPEPESEQPITEPESELESNVKEVQPEDGKVNKLESLNLGDDSESIDEMFTSVDLEKPTLDLRPKLKLQFKNSKQTVQ